MNALLCLGGLIALLFFIFWALLHDCHTPGKERQKKRREEEDKIAHKQKCDDLIVGLINSSATPDQIVFALINGLEFKTNKVPTISGLRYTFSVQGYWTIINHIFTKPNEFAKAFADEHIKDGQSLVKYLVKELWDCHKLSTIKEIQSSTLSDEVKSLILSTSN